MRVFAEVYSADGTSMLGLLPRIASLSLQERLDSLGSVNFVVPSTDPQAVDLLAVGKRIHFYCEDEWRKRYLTQGILLKKTLTEQAGSRIVTWEVSDPLEEMLRRWTSRGRVVNDANFIATINELVREVPGWRAIIDAGVTNVTARFDGVSLLKAVRGLANKKGLHVRIAGANRVLVGALGDQVMRITKVGEPSPELRGNWSVALIERLELVEDGIDMFNWIVPVAGGQDGVPALTLKRSTRSSPYTIQTETASDGRTIYYLKDSTAISSYGTIQRMLALQDVIPVAEGSAAMVNASNMLYDWAAAQLSRRKDPQTIYRVAIKKIDRDLHPGDKVRLDYNGWVFQKDSDDALQKIDYADIHDVFWVISKSETFTEGGRSAILELSNVDIAEVTAEGQLAGLEGSFRDGQIGLLLKTERLEADNQVTQTAEIEPGSGGTFTLQFVAGTVELSKALLTISREAFWGPDTLTVTVDGETVTEDQDGNPGPFLGGAGFGDSVTLDLEDYLTDEPTTGVDIMDEHTITVSCAYHSGTITLVFDIVQVLAQV